MQDKANYNFLYLALNTIFVPHKANYSHEDICRQGSRNAKIA